MQIVKSQILGAFVQVAGRKVTDCTVFGLLVTLDRDNRLDPESGVNDAKGWVVLDMGDAPEIVPVTYAPASGRPQIKTPSIDRTYLDTLVD